MRLSITSGIVLLLIGTVGAIFVTTASAEEAGNPTILPEPTSKAPAKFISKSSGAILIAMTALYKIECEAGTATGEFTSKRLGVVSLTFKNCLSNAHTSCRTEGFAAGEIVFSKTDIHLVAYKDLKEALQIAFVIKIPPSIQINCTTGSFFWRGSLMASIDGTKSESKTKTLKFLLRQTESKEELSECELDKEFCFEGKVHKKFVPELVAGLEPYPEFGISRADEVTFEKEIAFDY